MLECLAHSIPLISAAGNWLYGLKPEPGSLVSLNIVTPKISWQQTVGSSAGGSHVWLHFPGQTGPCGALELPQVATGVGTLGEEMDPQKSLDQEVECLADFVRKKEDRDVRERLHLDSGSAPWIIPC